jgi:DNA-binding NtrC family response regulator
MPAKILVVDDEPDLELLIRQRFRRHIRDQEWHFVFAHNGVEALALLRSDLEIDLVLTDINMPEMDGLTLLEHLPTLNPVLRAIMITAYGDMRNIRMAMQRGAYDFLTSVAERSSFPFFRVFEVFI